MHTEAQLKNKLRETLIVVQIFNHALNRLRLLKATSLKHLQV